MRTARLVVSFSLACVAIPALARAQCATTWHVVDGLAGVDGVVFASTVWDPDGAGPLAPKIVYAGSFAAAGTITQCGDIVMQDTVTGAWSTASSGTNGFIHCVVASPTGELVIGGEFTSVGGVPANNVAAFDGFRWAAVGIGGGINGPVHALTFLASGEMVAGGSFTTAGGNACNNIARWDGTSWWPYGAGASANAPTVASVRSLLALPNGDFLAGGQFLAMDGVVATNLARWSNGTWSSLGGANDFVRAMVVMPNGDLVAGGDFTSIGGVNAAYVARWNGTSWTPMAGTVPGQAWVRSLCVLPNGELIAACNTGFLNGVAVGGVARWNGVWASLGGGTNGQAWTVTLLPNGDVLAAGLFTVAGTTPVANAGVWNAALGWSAVSPASSDGKIVNLSVAPNGDVLAAGSFTRIGTAQVQGIARWNGTTWSAVGGSLPTSQAVAARANGTILAGFGDGFRYWNGVTWGPQQLSLGGVEAIVVMPNGDFIAGGNFAGGPPQVSKIGRYDGTTWSPLGSGVNDAVRALLVLPDGSLVVVGDFTTAGGAPAFRIAKWDGTAWSAPFGLGFDSPVYALARLPNGDIVAGGAFTASSTTVVDRIARWNGSNWLPLGTGMNQPVTSLVALPNGDVIAGGTFTAAGGVPASRIARWNGSTWAAIDGGVAGGTSVVVEALAFDRNGELAVGGSFQTVGSQESPNFARVATSCAATATSAGSGCPGSGGANVLSAITRPWVDATFTARGTGLPSQAIVLTLTSFTTIAPGALPLSSVFAIAGPGCDVLVAPDILGVVLATAGSAESSFFLPNSPPLVGLTFHHQMVPIEIDNLGAWIAITATNTLQLTAGAF